MQFYVFGRRSGASIGPVGLLFFFPALVAVWLLVVFVKLLVVVAILIGQLIIYISRKWANRANRN